MERTYLNEQERIYATAFQLIGLNLPDDIVLRMIHLLGIIKEGKVEELDVRTAVNIKCLAEKELKKRIEQAELQQQNV